MLSLSLNSFPSTARFDPGDVLSETLHFARLNKPGTRLGLETISIQEFKFKESSYLLCTVITVYNKKKYSKLSTHVFGPEYLFGLLKRGCSAAILQIVVFFSITLRHLNNNKFLLNSS